MPAPNYAFAKKQRELAKKQKNEEKLRQKANKKAGDNPDAAQPPAKPPQG